ncbi:MAG: AMP-binding protein [Deltaproteobacteria bacterium]|nr:AMP-binding protein [Deltaproteobacteria bacterium]
MANGRKTHGELLKGLWKPFSQEEIERYASKGFFHNITVCDCLDRNARLRPQRLAVADEKKELTWKGLKEKTNRLAIHLSKLGVENGDFFVLQLPNVAEFLILFFALNRLGAIPVMCLPRHRRLEIDHELRVHQAKGICVPVNEKFDYVAMVQELRPEHEHLEVFITAGREAPGGWQAIEELLEEPVERDYPRDYLNQFRPDPNDICIEQLSGGSTGVPKGIPRTHNDYICGWDYVGRAYGYTDDSVALVTIPVAHNASMENICGPAIYRGGSIVLCNSTRPERSFQMIEKYRVTHTLIVPVLVLYWKDAFETSKKYDLSSFKVLAAGGQKSRPEVVEWCIDTFGVNFSNTFGMAEGPQISTRWDSPKETQMHTVGRPIIEDPEVEVRLVDDQNREVKRGEVGELVTRGPLNFRGYFKAEEENRLAFDKEGFFHTGDLMSLREDGYYIVEGRKKDTILRGGENVYPERVEDQLKEHPKVANCAAVGMPDMLLGEKMCAVVQPVKGEKIDFQEIVQYLKDKGTAVFQLPERLEIVSGWPLTPVDKIDKRGLRAYITTKLFQEKVIDKEVGDEYLKKDKITIDDVLSARVKIDFTGTPP